MKNWFRSIRLIDTVHFRGEYFPENFKLFPDKNDQKRVTLPNLLSKLSKKQKLFPDEYPQIM